jgi:hypothetical protein
LEDDVEHCQVYGTPGQNQEGIDLFARPKVSNKYTVYQCKKVQTFAPSDIRRAVSEFLKGSWVDRTERFVLCTQESLIPTQRAEEIEKQNRVLRRKGIRLIPWGSDELSGKLKLQPRIVNDFFGREWVKQFIGHEAAAALAKRLDLGELREFRAKARQFYSHVFQAHDPGIPSAQLFSSTHIPLPSRFIVPDIYDSQIAPSDERLNDFERQLEQIQRTEQEDSISEISALPLARLQREPDILQFKQRMQIDAWFTNETDLYVVLGEPGAGKSTFLRYLALQLLDDASGNVPLCKKWRNRLPVWIPFALWTKVISSSAVGESSLLKALQQWLMTWDEERLWPVFERALDDERLLILIDGLDEWTNESAAGIALDKLQVFVRQRKVGAIVTSRPHGYRKLGMQEEGWKVGELAKLSFSQQKELANIWFVHKGLTITPSLEVEEVRRRASFETTDFMEDLRRVPDLGELAKSLILFCLLIFLRFQNAQLPQSRFKAYEQIVDHLILVHPQKRKQAALITSVEGDLSQEDINGLLAFLALEIQEKYREGVIEKKIAETIISQHIEQDLGFETPKAISLAREVIQSTENVVGLLVAKSQIEVGFLHRTFLEYLAALRMSVLPYALQCEKVEAHSSNYQWHDVILALLTLTKRTEDIDKLLEKIDIRLNSDSVIDRHANEHLLCEAAFMHSRCSLQVANKILQQAFRTVEWECWEPHRQRVLRTVLDGLRQPRLRNAITKRLRTWFPATGWSRSSVLEAMAEWDKAPEVIECLKRALTDYEGFDQRVAAKALAMLGAGDDAIGNQISLLARTSDIPSARAAAIEALIEGWPSHTKLENILTEGVESPSPDIQAVSIYGKVRTGIHETNDLRRLLSLGSNYSGLSFNWMEIIYLGIKLGWPRSTEVKQLCLNSLGRYHYRQDYLDQEIACKLLLEGYPRDPDTVRYCVDQILHEPYPFSTAGGYGHDVWRSLPVLFRDNKDLVQALDEWIPTKEGFEPQVSAAALVGRTDIGKAKLLTLNKKHIPFWFAQALLDGWGMEDPQVSQLLGGMAHGTAAETSQIGHLLPFIITDSESCRRRLLDVLKDPACERPDFVLRGLQHLGNTEGDNEAIEAILERLRNGTKLVYRPGLVRSVFESYATDRRVRDLALRELSLPEGHYGAVAKAYKDDPEIRTRVLEIACPLPISSRRQIVQFIGRGIGDPKLESSLLATYDLEADRNLIVEQSVAYHRLLARHPPPPPLEVDKLKANLFSLGPSYEQLRQGTLCGLVILGQPEYVKNARDPWEGNKNFTVPLRVHAKTSVSFIRFLLEEWKECRPLLFDEALTEDEETLARKWEDLCLLAYDYDLPRKDALQFLESTKKKSAGPNTLKFIARAKPCSKMLLEYCLSSLIADEHSLYGDLTERIAADLLAANFAGDSDVLSMLPPAIDESEINSSVVVALCDGWPDSIQLASVFEFCKDRQIQLSPVAFFSLVCAKSKMEKVLKLTRDELTMFTPNHGRRIQLLIKPMLKRLQNDPTLHEALKTHLFSNPTPSEKGSFSRLIAASAGVSDELRTWCVRELAYQHRQDITPEIGVDMFQGRLRPVRQSLLDVLDLGDLP